MRAGWPSRAAALVLLWVVAGLALTVWLTDPAPLRKLRLAQFDQFQRWQPRPAADAPVRVVDIDEASLAAFGQWPWPRTRMAQLVERLSEAGAAVVAFDVIMAEPDRTSPAAAARLWQAPQVQALLAQLPDHDAVFAASLQGRPVVLGASLVRQAEEGGAPPPMPAASAPVHRVVRLGADPRSFLPPFDAAVWPLPAFTATAAGTGFLNLAADDDGVVRRVPLLLRLGDQLVPSLAAETLRVAQGDRNLVTLADASGVQEVRIGRQVLPATPEAELWLHYGEDRPERFVSATRVLQGHLRPGELRGHLVLVGSSAAGLMDLRASPRGHLMPGVLAHATALEQVLTGHYLQRPTWAKGLEALLLLAGSLVVGLVALAAPVRTASAVAAGGLALLAGGAWLAFSRQGLLLDAVNPALAVLAVFAVASGTHHWMAERRQRWLRTAFARYVSPNRVAHLLAHPEMLHLGGQRQACSFVFTDLVGFTAMMEREPPAQVVALLNDYLDGMLDIAFRHEGTLDRIVGDAIAVLFSAPVPQADHQRRALACALDMHAFAVSHAQRLRAQGLAWGDTRIGVHSGEVIVGNFGGQRMFDYRALGDPVNTASRLEGANRHLGTLVCASADVLAGAPELPVRPVGRLVLKGKQLPLEVATPEAALHSCAPAADYAAALALLRQGTPAGLARALQHLEALALAHPADPLVALHLRRLQAGATDDLIVLDGK